MCFSLQRRANFPHPNFKKWSVHLIFFNFSFANVLLATAACKFFTCQLQKVARECQFFSILTSKCASRYSGVQIFHLPTSKSGPNPSVFWHFDFKMRFSLQLVAFPQWPPHPPLYRGYFSTQPTHKSLQNTAFRDFSTFSRLWSSHLSRMCIFFLAALVFQLSILSEVRLLNFLR